MDETKATAHFAGEDRDFWLPMSRVVAFEREADCSIFALFYALGENLAASQDITGGMMFVGGSDARLKQCHSLIRNALIGAGEAEKEAAELVQVYCFPARPAIHDAALAFKILRAAIYGVRLPESGKKKTEPESRGSS